MVVVSKTHCSKMLKQNEFSTVERDGRAPFWRYYRMIQTAEKKDTNFIQCRCGRLDEYLPEKGSKNISQHYLKCNALSKNNGPMDTFVTKEKQITKEEKEDLLHATAAYCWKDMRPMYAVEGRGLLKLLAAVSALSAKYGILDEKQIHTCLPCPNTVSARHKRIRFVFREF